MDELAQFNQERWNELVEAGVTFSRPFLNMDETAARQAVDPYGILGDVHGQQVLCLAGGGGQQSAAFAVLGAVVTVFDLSEAQLKRDQETAVLYNLPIQTIQGDMRDLSRFAPASFDVVWHAYSIDFVPDARQVFNEVARVLKPGGFYRLESHNPFVKGMDETNWNGEGYVLKRPYVTGEVTFDDSYWTFEDENGRLQKVLGPREFLHPLSTLINGLIGTGFTLLGVWESLQGDPNAEPGSWDHFIAVASPWLTFWAKRAAIND